MAGIHPVHVAANGIDLTVVRDEAVGVGQLPGGKSIRGETLVHHTKRADDIGIGELFVKLCNLRGQQQAFVDNGARGKRRNVEHTLIGNVRIHYFHFGAFADDV